MTDYSIQIAWETIALFVLVPCLISIPLAAFLIVRDEREQERDRRREAEWFGETGV